HLIQRVLLHLYNKGEYAPGKGFEPRLCHRLDTGTSGLVLVAKTAQAYSLLTGLIKERSVKKEYLCVTFGRPKPEKATLNDYLSKDSKKGRVRIGDQHLPDARPI
ncbi:pseudouridine synthase, RluA family, partial [gut metagenome]